MFGHTRPKLPASTSASTPLPFNARFPAQVAQAFQTSSVSTETGSEDDISVINAFLHELSMPRRLEPRKTSISSRSANLRIKMEYRGEKTCIEMERPVSFPDLKKHLYSKYGRQLNIFYTLSNNELVVPIRNQQELDRAIELLDKSTSQRSLRLLLSQHQSDSGLGNCCSGNNSPTNSLQPDASGTYSALPSRIIEISPSECPSSCPSCRKYSPRSGGGSSASSGIFIRDYEFDEKKGVCTPRAPTNWKQGKCIGKGAFGEVYLCYDIDTGREVALKRVYFAKNDTHIREAIIQLENEINLLSTIQHPRIVQYLGAQRTEDSLSIFMEYMAGGSVEDLIRTYGALSSSVAKKYTYQVLQGLEYLHRNEMIHRDIKSGNILRDSDGNVKIGDFGSAKSLQKICSQQSAATFAGTSIYMAPEVVTAKAPYGRKADIWSLGCVLLEMLTGKSPWGEYEPIVVMSLIAHCDLSYQLPAKTDPSLADLLSSVLERSPEKRPCAAELLKHHHAFQGFANLQQ